MPVIILLAIFAVLVFWLMNAYNNLARMRNKRKKAFADIDVLLRQRHDLIPQLVETVKGYTGHEKNGLQKIKEARSAAVSATTIEDKIKSEQLLTTVLRGIRVQVETYPDLKADLKFLKLQDELAAIETNVAAGRRIFNAATMEYNNVVETFPSNLIASNFGFIKEPMFDLGTENRVQLEEPPKVSF